MLPVLFTAGSFVFYTYGVFVVLALFWFLYLAWKYIRITEHKEEEIFDRIIGSLFIALIVGRVVYVAFHYDTVLQDGALGFFALHLYPGLHQLSAFIAFGLSLVIPRTPHMKHSGSEIVTYLAPALFASFAILSFGGVFAGTDVGLITTFPVRIKYAVYDGLRHVPGLYEGILYLIGALAAHHVILHVRRHKMKKGMVVALLYWFVSFIHVGVAQLRDIVSYQQNAYYQLFDLYLGIVTLLTSLVFIVYYVRSHIVSMFYYLLRPFSRHG